MAHAPGEVASQRRAQAVFLSLQTDILSPRPLSVCECLQQLRQLHNLEAWKDVKSTFRQIVQCPTRLHLLGVFVLAECWDKCESEIVDDLFKPLEPASLRLAARDRIRECRQWEASLTPTMRAARQGDFTTFINNVKASPHKLNETDSMGHDVMFWALTGQTCNAILDYLLTVSRPTVLRRFGGRCVLHSAVYASPETVNYLLSKPRVVALVNQRDHYSENDQWSVCYYGNTMAGSCAKWAVVRLDRNQMPSRLASAKTRRDLAAIATIKFEGKGDVLDDQSRLDLDRAKAAASRTQQPDRSPLHYAVEEGNFVLAERLLDQGADVDEKDWFGMTPLHVAAKHGYGDLVQLLCRRGADRSLVDSTNSTALDVARDNGQLL